MKVQTVRCNECGGPLDIKPMVNFVTCNYCNASLKVHRDESTIYSEVLEDLNRKTNTLIKDVNYLKGERVRDGLDKLDKKWLTYHDRFSKGDTSTFHVPNEDSLLNRSNINVLLVILPTIFGLSVFILLAGSFSFSLSLFGFLVLLVLGFVGLIAYKTQVSMAEEYFDIKKTYEKRRKALITEIRELQES